MRLLIDILGLESCIKLGFNGAGDVPSFPFPDQSERIGYLYHTHYNEQNIVVGTQDIGRGRIGYYLNIFPGREPIDGIEGQEYQWWRDQVFATALPKNRLLLRQLIEQLSRLT